MQSLLSMIFSGASQRGALLAFLMLNAWMDLRKRCVSLSSCSLVGAFGMLAAAANGTLPEKLFFLFQVLTGLLLLLGLSRGGIGLGDVWVLLVLVFFIGRFEFLLDLSTGVVLCAFMALLFWKREEGEEGQELPFIPFLLTGYLWIRIGSGGIG